jgi:hypothetical protein
MNSLIRVCHKVDTEASECDASGLRSRGERTERSIMVQDAVHGWTREDAGGRIQRSM